MNKDNCFDECTTYCACGDCGEFEDILSCGVMSIVEGEYRKFNYSGGFNTIKNNGGILGIDNFYIERVVYNNPATIMFFSDGTKTVAKTHNADVYNKETGFILCLLKKLAGTTNVHDLLKYWLPDPESDKAVVTNADVRKVRRNEK